MYQLIKKIIKKNSSLTKFLIFIISENWLFRFYSFLNLPFKVKLLNKEYIELYPKGQISSILFYEKFENTQLYIFQKILKRGMIIVDAGANIGLYSIVASKMVGENGKILAFEPSSETFNWLNNNIILNNIHNINSFKCGLGDISDQELILFQDDGYDDAERYIISNSITDIDRDTAFQEKVSINTLDNILNLIGIDSLDFLKIDTEGYEYFILNGARSILQNSKSLVILMECTAQGTLRSGTTQEKVFQLVKSYGYEIYYWDEVNGIWCNDLKGCYSIGDVWACKDFSLINFKNNK